MDSGNVFLNELLDLTEWSYVLREDTRQLVYANRRIMEEFGNEVLSRPWDQVFSDTFFMRIFREERPESGSSFWELADVKRNVYLMVRSRWIDRDGSTYRLGTVSSTCDISGVSKDMAALTNEYRAMMEEKQRLLEEVEWYAYHDQLTRLGNRNKFKRDSEALFTDCENLGLVNMDINNLKKINDRYGHLAGDAAIGRVGKILARLAREEGTYCYRMGGDEFLLVKTGCGQDCLDNICRQIREFLMKSQETEGTFICEAAMGTALGEAGMQMEKLQNTADAHMYENKRINARRNI